MKRYTLIDNKTGCKSEYSTIEWVSVWWLMWVFGVLTGMLVC